MEKGVFLNTNGKGNGGKLANPPTIIWWEKPKVKMGLNSKGNEKALSL
jgi:hypothetical protein